MKRQNEMHPGSRRTFALAVSVLETVQETTQETLEETTPQTCGCAAGSLCRQAKTADQCAAMTGSCGNPFHRVDACETEAVATCDRAAEIVYTYAAHTIGLLQHAKDACAGGAVAGTFTLVPPPAPVGAPCSCQRTAGVCLQTYGDACTTLACADPAVRSETACSDTNRIPGRCVKFDGQAEVVFYSPAVASPSDAEAGCMSASLPEFMWIPDGL